MPEIHIKTLQMPSVTLNGVPITFPFKRVDALLYYMVCRKTASRREIVNLLWENSDDETGYKNLRHTLYTLKKTLGVELLVSPHKSTIQLNPDIPITSDYDDFVTNDDFSAYSGAFLHSFSVKNADNFEDWIFATREELQSKYLRGLAEKAQDSLDENKTAAAEKYAFDYLREDPLDERMTVLLMKIYLDTQLYHKATKVYQNFRTQLADELGITPMNETTALYYDIMNRWNSIATQAEDMQKNELPVGHSEVLCLMQSRFRDFSLSSGKYCSFLLWGEKGVGKTYILNSFLSQTDLSGVAVFSGTCHQTSSSAPFEPWNTIMLSAAEYILANSIQIPEPVRNAVSDIFSVFSENFDSRNHIPPRKCSPVHIDNIAMFFSILSRRKKLVFVLENIHFIDSASMELLDALLRRMNSNQIMFILTCRDFLSAFIKRSLVTQLEDKLLSKIDIGCFSFEDTVLTLRSELGEQITDNLARRVYEETSGNPFLISELVASITKNGSINELSLSTNNIMEQRLSGLSVQSRQLIDIISLFPDHAPCELLSSITDKSPNELLNLYEELKSRSLVEELCVCDESVLSFTHSKMRDFIYQSQSYFKRKSLHLRVARLLEREYTDSDGRLCSRLIYHFASGADVVNEVKYRILGLEMYSSTMHQYPSVLLENSNMPVPKDVDMQSYIVQLCSSLEELRKKNEDPLLIERLEGIMLCIKGRWGIFSGNYNLALDAIGKILSDPTFQLDTSFTLEAYFLLTLYSSRINDMEQMERRIAAGMSLGESAGNGAEIARFMLLRGYYFLRLGEFDRSAYYVAEAMERFMRLQNSRRYRMFIMSAYHYLGEIKRKQKDFAGACNEYKMGVSVLSGITHIPGIAAMYTDYGRAALALDDHTKARELFRTACDIYNVTGELFGKAMAFAYNGYYLALEGNYDASVESLKRAGDYAAIGGIVQDNGIYWCILAQLRQRLDMAYTHNNSLDLFLQKPLTLYCKKGIKLLSEDPYAYELETLKKCLYYGINKERPYTTDELYSKNKNFLTE